MADGIGNMADLPGGELVARAHAAVGAARAFSAAAKAATEARVMHDGRVDAGAADRDQRMVHGFAWIVTTVEAMAAAAAWADGLRHRGTLAAGEAAVLAIGFGEYLHQLLGGIPMSQNEMVRPAELGLGAAAATLARDPAVEWFLEHGNTAERRADWSGTCATAARSTRRWATRRWT